MRCRACQAENAEGIRTCLQCGGPLDRPCRSCGTLSVPGARFCSHCGTKVDIAAEGGAGTLPEAQTGAFASERKNVSVLFADLSGSLGLLEPDPEQAKRLLEGVLDQLIAAVRQYGGTVTQVMGDGIMAIFGAPLAYEDHAFRACHAALAMHEKIRTDPPGQRRGLAIRVGICSGPVVVGARGDGLDFQYTAFGRTAHLAARMEQMAQPGGILISETTWRLIAGNAIARSQGSVSIRGLDTPMELFELISIGRSWRRTHGAAAALPFVGREAELAMLTYALTETAVGNGRIVAINGEPGVGKSRLIAEFLGDHVPEAWLTLQARGTAHTTPAPFAGMAEALADCFEDSASEPEEPHVGRTKRERISARLQDLGKDLDRHLPAFLSLYGISEEKGWTELSAEQRRRRVARAVVECLAAESRRQPILLVIDDLQWIDRDSVEILSAIAEIPLDTRILLLVTYRPEYHHDWHRTPRYVQIPLESLKGEKAERFLESLLGSHASVMSLRETLLERTGGNPFFLEESVRTLAGSGTLSGKRGRYRLTRPMGEEIPLKVQDVIAMRIDRLPSADKRVLQTAAAFGYEITASMLATVLGIDADELWRRLAHLVRAEFLVTTARAAEQLLTFKHPLTHDVAYENLIQEERKQLHGRIVEVLESLHQGRLEDVFDTLAFHAERAAQSEKAIGYLQSAGAHALSRAACQHAVGCFDRALMLSERLPESPVRFEAELDLRLRMRNALMPLGRHTEVLPHLRRAETLARQGADEKCLAQIRSYLSHYYWLVGEWDDAIETGRQALRAAEELEDFGLVVTTRFILGLALYSTGRFDEAIESLRTNSTVLTGAEAAERYGMFSLPAVVSRGYLAWCFAERGEFEAALVPAREAKAIAERAGHAFDRVQGCLALAGVYLIHGMPADAVAELEPAFDLCERADILILMPRVAACLGYAYGLEGRMDEALALAERSLQRAEAMRLRSMHTLCLRWAAEVKLLAGRIADGLEIADQLRQRCQANGEAGNEAWALYLLGTALAESDRVEEAAATLDKAIHLSERLGLRPLLAHCRRRLGLVQTAQGQEADSRRNLASAAALYREMGMTLWVNETPRRGGGVASDTAVRETPSQRLP